MVQLYIRLTGTSNNPIVYDMDYDFKIGKSIKLKSGDDVTIFSCGSSVFQALKASELLKEKRFHVQLLTCTQLNL